MERVFGKFATHRTLKGRGQRKTLNTQIKGSGSQGINTAIKDRKL